MKVLPFPLCLRPVRHLRISAALLRATALELAILAGHLLLYPSGLTPERRTPDRPASDHPGPSNAELPPHTATLPTGPGLSHPPAVLLHGFVDNRSVFVLLRRSLARHGWRHLECLNYSPLTCDIRAAADLLGRHIEEICARTGHREVDIVGHSLGGLIARYYVQRLGGDERVHTLVTLGSPHAGTVTARLVPVQLCRQLRPGSDLYVELAEPADRCRTRFVAYWSDLDQMILPHGNARLDHPDLYVRNVRVHGVGHMSLPLDGQVVHEISAVLSQLDWDGTTLRAGITPLMEETAVPRRRLSRRPLSAS